MKKYELMTMAKGSIGEESAKKLSKDIAELITSLGGKILNSEVWGKRKLAYKIKQEKEGFYEIVSLEFPMEQISVLKTKLNLMPNLVRYLISA